MAKSKKAQAKKVVKKAKKNKFLSFLIIVIIIGVLVLGGMSYMKLSKINNNLAKVNLDNIPSEISSPVDFTLPSVDGVEFSWNVSSEFFPTLVEVKRPTHSEGTKGTTIVLNATIKLNVIDKIVDNILKFGLANKSWNKNVKVLALEATDKELVVEYSETISLPNTVYTDLQLRTESVACEGVTITWETNNPLIITCDGKKTGLGAAILTATIKKGTEEVKKEFSVTTALASDIVVIDYEFDDYKDSTYVNTDSYYDITIEGGMAKEDGITFKAKSDGSSQGVILTNKINNITKVKFTYKYGASSKKDNYTKNSFVELFYSNDGETFESLKKETLADSNTHDFSCDVAFLSGYLKVVVTTEYAESYIVVDELYVSRAFSSSDVEEALKQSLPTKVSKNYDLPLTTSYGGKVTYSSSNEAVLSKLGVVKEVSEPTTITMNVVVTGFDFDVSFDVEIKVVGPSSVEPLEIRFIDLNKNGGNSDCGESTYIRIGTIDVLIDAGDDYTQTFENVKACINEYSLDKELDYVIATHPDSDHIGSMDSVINEFKVLHLITFVENTGDTTGVFNNYKKEYTD